MELSERPSTVYFYVHFPDKKAVFVELVKELSRRLRQDMGRHGGGEGEEAWRRHG